jgi:predicted nucleotidyltransferase
MDKIHQLIPLSKLQAFCSKWKIKTFYVFGSVLRDDFKNSSDLDIMIEFLDHADWSLLDHVEMKDELSSITGRSIDLLTKKSVERSLNKIRKEEILRTAQAIYDAAA